MKATNASQRRSLAQRARSFLEFLDTPADAALLARMLAWRVSLPLLKHMLALPRLARLMCARASPDPRRPARERRIATMTAWLYRPGGTLAARDNCLERSLLAYRYLSREGAEPTLVVGMRRVPNHGEARGHVWVTVDDNPVIDTESSLAAFAPVVSFGPGGVEQRDRSAT
jgi:hypothetical protein